MICDVCKEKPATVHYTEIINNKIHKMDLCEECAQEKNLGFNTQFSVADILKGLTEPAQTATETKAVVCPFCGLSYNKFKKIGRLGCGECYKAFEPNLESIINDVHKNTMHVGKSPVSESRPIDKAKLKIDELQEQLKTAVAREEYEKAATIRDTIKALQDKEDTQS